MRHLKLAIIRKVFGPGETTYSLKVVEQTHRRSAFTPEGEDHFIYDGLEIRSDSYPDFSTTAGMGGVPRLWVRGSGAERDDREILVPAAYLDKIKAAVRAYNRAFTFEVAEYVE